VDDYPKIIEGLLQRIAKLKKTIASLQEQLEQERRENARQATPFRRREKKKTCRRTSTKKSTNPSTTVPNAALLDIELIFLPSYSPNSNLIERY